MELKDQEVIYCQVCKEYHVRIGQTILCSPMVNVTNKHNKIEGK